jgi:hypothetical protein
MVMSASGRRRAVFAFSRLWAYPGVQLVLFCIGSLLLFYRNLGRTFAADDFEVIRRVVVEHRFFIPGFFRPLSDVTLFGNYLIGGLNPAVYYLFNILVHGVNCFLLYRFCLRWGPPGGYALLAALFFLVYPFHSEGIDWILGRGASLCTMFGLAALLVMVSEGAFARKLFWASVFYFLGMAAYEPVILLPLFGLVVIKGGRERRQWAIVMGSVFLLHLAVRVWASGSVAGDYGGEFFGAKVSRLAGNLIKVVARLFLPPSDRVRLMTGLFLVVVAGLVVVLIVYARRWGWSRLRFLRALFLLLGISLIFPVVTAVSTRTSESDRMLYFPSVFFCCILSYFLVEVVRGRSWRIGIAGLLLVYMVVFLEKTNDNWVRASGITREILLDVGKSSSGRAFVYNLPDEADGAFIFRSGFPEAYQMMYPGRPAPVVVSHLTRMSEPYQVLRIKAAVMFSWEPIMGQDSLLLHDHDDGRTWRISRDDRLYFWNGWKLELLH